MALVMQHLAQWPPFCVINTGKNVLQSLAACPRETLLLLALHVAILLIWASIFHMVVEPQISGKSAKSHEIHKNTENTKIW